MSATLLLPLERERLAALHEYELLDQPADDELSAVVRVAAMIADMPTASLNLIDENRQCQLTTVGFDGADTPRTSSMCDVHFRTGHTVHTPDARLHPSYEHNPWVDGRLHTVRSYTSVPLITPSGHALGTLCVFDVVPKKLDERQLRRLEDLGDVLVSLFERRRQARLNAALAIAAALGERQLQAAVTELERSNDELEGFAAAVSHDLVRPLAGAHGYLEMLHALYAPQLDDRGAKWVDGSLRAVERMQQLVQALLNYARAGHAPCVPHQVDLADVMSQVTADLHTLVESTGAEVTTEGRLPVVSGDPTLLRQLLQNLVDNAIKYRHPDRTPRIRVGCSPAPGGWTVTVADNGMGIPAEHRDRIFDMFAQVDPESRKGYGIGLATCLRIAERHGGGITLADTPGGGTTIRLNLQSRPGDE
ncbi:GAF domain-containing sensor histidine kinase [Actinoplanes sp. NPDC051851]|uniref:GAF domain-containing sensor histidine kinase n=1 Tax=Actinoplanes sp. NPDC051851 TaxID=3154753 RepID=UPI00344A799E